MLNLCLALVSLLGSFWVSGTVGTQAYVAGAVAMVVVGIAASLALLLSFTQSRHTGSNNGVSGVLLAMLIRMGLPMGVMLFMQQIHSPLLEAGFMGLLVLNYLVALPIETLMSLKLLRESDSSVSEANSEAKVSDTKVSGSAISG